MGLILTVLVLMLVVAAGVAAGVADYAAKKGYSYAGFFSFALFFLPFAIMTAVLAPPKATVVGVEPRQSTSARRGEEPTSDRATDGRAYLETLYAKAMHPKAVEKNLADAVAEGRLSQEAYDEAVALHRRGR